jgi:predicted amidohydrolase
MRPSALSTEAPLAILDLPARNALPYCRDGRVKITIACGQFEAAQGDLGRNIGVMKEQARQARSLGAGMIVFPELCVPGYPSTRDAASLAVPIDGEEIGGLRETARREGVALCFGFAERTSSGSLHNSMAFIDRNGEILAVQRKVHLWVSERDWATEGERFGSFASGPLRLGMWICYDTRFPEAARALALQGATAGLVGSAWFGPAEEWELALRARALDNGIFAAGAALQGAFEGAAFHGASLIVDPHGKVLAQGREGRDEVIAAGYDDEAVASFRRRLPLLEHRRPGAYA